MGLLLLPPRTAECESLLALCFTRMEICDLFSAAEIRILLFLHRAARHGAACIDKLPVPRHDAQTVAILFGDPPRCVQVFCDESAPEKGIEEILIHRLAGEKARGDTADPRLLRRHHFRPVVIARMHGLQGIKGRAAQMLLRKPADDLSRCLRRIRHDIGNLSAERCFRGLHIFVRHTDELSERPMDGLTETVCLLHDGLRHAGKARVFLFRPFQIRLLRTDRRKQRLLLPFFTAQTKTQLLRRSQCFAVLLALLRKSGEALRLLLLFTKKLGQLARGCFFLLGEGCLLLLMLIDLRCQTLDVFSCMYKLLAHLLLFLLLFLRKSQRPHIGGLSLCQRS